MAFQIFWRHGKSTDIKPEHKETFLVQYAHVQWGSATDFDTR